MHAVGRLGCMERTDSTCVATPPPPHPLSRHPVSSLHPPPSRPREDAEAAALAAARQDRDLAHALDRSRRVGGLLLKAEDEELGRVGALADELLAREYASPQRARACQAEAADSVRCYADNADNPLACGAAVEAYSACAKAAWQEALQRSV